jgi:Ca2+-binding RTX toxin-like protein
MNGGAGIDTLDYSLSPNGVDVRLFSGAAAGGSANGDTYSSIENIIGAATKTDTLAGDANANSIWGGGGNETITGREGADTLHGEAGNDTLLGGADSDVLIGGIGADTLGGGVQDDTADYSASDAGVTVNLQTGSGAGGHAQGDVLVSIEDVIGSAFNDVIIGKNNVWDNVFDGRGGDDTYTGGLGDDVFVFRLNEGSDTITDFLAGGADDAVQLAGFGAAFDSFGEIIAAATQIGADTVIDFGGGQTLTLQNVTLANLDASDFLFGGG